MKYQYILVTLRQYDTPKIIDLVNTIMEMDDVVQVGNLEWEKDSDVPPYFFVYVNKGVDLEPIAAEIRKNPFVAEAGEPPARTAV